jgi:hypothetical protein
VAWALAEAFRRGFWDITTTAWRLSTKAPGKQGTFTRGPRPDRGHGAHAVRTAAESVRPNSSMDCSRILNFCTLPVTVIGKASTVLT